MELNLSEKVINLMDVFLDETQELVTSSIVQVPQKKDFIPTAMVPAKSKKNKKSITIGEIARYVYGYDAKDNIRKDFEKLIAMVKEQNPNMSYLTVSIDRKELPQTITNFIKRTRTKEEKDAVKDRHEQRQFAKILKEREAEALLVRSDMNRNLQINAVNLLSLSDFISPDLKEILAKELNLDSDLFPTKLSKDIYYNINVVRVRVKLHGKMHNDTYPESQYSKIINSMEALLTKAIDVSNIKAIPEKLIKDTQHQIFVIMALHNLLSRTRPDVVKKININNIFIAIFDKLLSSVEDPKQKESLSKFLIRTIQHNKKQHEYNNDEESPEVQLGSKYLRLVKETSVEEQEPVIEHALEDRAIQEERTDEYGSYADFFNDL